MIRRFLVAITLFIAFALPQELVAKDKFVVVIDAGHGGGDVGTPHRKCRQDEKTIALNVALQLGTLIESNYRDVQVVYTRKTDVYPSLPERTQIARKAQGDLFISIHVNAADISSARGFETYVFGITGLAGKSASEQKRIRQRTMLERENLDINGKQIDFEKAVDMQTKILCQTQREKHNKYSQQMAELVQNIMISDLRQSSYKHNVVDRGVKAKNIFVLCYSPMPSILVELGYMSNAVEEKFINSVEGQNLLANSLYKAFAKYKSNWNKRQLNYVESNNTEAQPEVKAEVKPEPVKEAAPKAAPVAETKAEVKAEPVVEKKAEPAKPETKAEVKAETKATPANDATTQATPTTTKKAEPAKAETKPEVKPEPVKEVAAPKAAALTEKKAEAKAEKKAEAKAETQAAPVAAKKGTGHTFKIQLLTSTQLIKQGDPKLKGLWPVSYYTDGNLYKYTYKEASTKAALQPELMELRKELFKGAFIIEVDADGNRVK